MQLQAQVQAQARAHAQAQQRLVLDEAKRKELEEQRRREEEERRILREQAEDTAVGTEVGEIFAPYVPQRLNLVGAKAHPDPVVETSSLASVAPPQPTYALGLPPSVIEQGLLSALQLESIVYASMRFESRLPTGERAGFLLGDGAGIGKGRQIAALVMENWIRGRRRGVWISVSTDLLSDARRDLNDLGCSKIPLYHLSDQTYDPLTIQEGVIFLTYSCLVSQTRVPKTRTRLQQLIDWCGSTFDGVLAFDEAHKAKNLIPDAAGQKATKTGLAVSRLQRDLPSARVIYSTATVASSARQLAYAERLGLWGPGTAFPLGVQQFYSALDDRPVSALEVLSMDMKARGMYLARTLSYASAEFEVVELPLPRGFREIYDASCHAWALLYHFVQLLEQAAHRSQKVSKRGQADEALEDMNLEDDEFDDFVDDEAQAPGRKRHRAIPPAGHVPASEPVSDDLFGSDNIQQLSRTITTLYWGGHQRFFRGLCMSAKVPKLVEFAQRALDSGQCVVIGLQSTGEAGVDAALKSINIPSDFLSAPRTTYASIVNRVAVGCREFGVHVPSSLVDKARRFRDHLAWRHKVRNDLVDGTETFADDSFDFMATMYPSAEKAAPKLNLAARIGAVAGTAAAGAGDAGDDDDDDDEELGDLFAQVRAGGSKPEPETPGAVLDAAPTPGSKRRATESGLRVCGRTVFPGSTPRSLQEALLDIVHLIDMPNNPLDDLIDKLGGEQNVAEMTGRKGRMIRGASGQISYRLRTINEDGEGDDDADALSINWAEKERFLSGTKLVAIISEAASSGISLHAERRIPNQRRRVHFTLELPWSADRAIQQLGRSHRSNQSSGPIYKLLISELGGEKRFAMSVARRLQQMGAITQGDRRGVGASRELQQFNFESDVGKQALKKFYGAFSSHDPRLSVWPSFVPGLEEAAAGSDGADGPGDDSDIHKIRLHGEAPEDGDDDGSGDDDDRMLTDGDGDDDGDGETMIDIFDPKYTMPAFRADGMAVLSMVGMTKTLEQNDSDQRRAVQALALMGGDAEDLTADVRADKRKKDKQTDVKRFFNRLLGVPVLMQNRLFAYFMDVFQRVYSQASEAGKLDEGIAEIRGKSPKFVLKPIVVYTDAVHSDAKGYLNVLQVDCGVDWDQVYGMWEEYRAEAEANGTDIYMSGFHRQAMAQVSTGDHLVLLAIAKPDSRGTMYHIYRPYNINSRGMDRAMLTGTYRRITDLNIAQTAWKEQAKRRWCSHGPRCSTGATCTTGRRFRRYFILSGTIMPLWGLVSQEIRRHRSEDDKKKAAVRVGRVSGTTQDGEEKRIIGIVLPGDLDLRNCLHRFEKEQYMEHDADSIYKMVLSATKTGQKAFYRSFGDLEADDNDDDDDGDDLADFIVPDDVDVEPDSDDDVPMTDAKPKPDIKPRPDVKPCPERARAQPRQVITVLDDDDDSDDDAVIDLT